MFLILILNVDLIINVKKVKNDRYEDLSDLFVKLMKLTLVINIYE